MDGGPLGQARPRDLGTATAAPTLAGVLDRLRRHAAELEGLGIDRLWVYGSTARGEAKPWSDVDLFADLKPEVCWNIVRWGHVAGRLEEILERRVDFAPKRALPGELLRRAEKEAVAV